MEKNIKVDTVDDYIALQPAAVQKKLKEIRKAIKKAAPGAEEKISYGMPAYTLKGMLIYFAAHRNHIGLYPYPSAMEAFREEISKYKASKGTIHFGFDQPVPLDLIYEIVRFRVEENMIKEELKMKKKKK